MRDYVRDTLKKQIMELKLEPGRFISEKEIMEMLQVSRTPIREALVQLAQEGLIETIPQKGSFISPIDLGHVEESRFIRETLEAAVVREACGKLNAEQLLELQNLIAMQELCVQEGNFARLFDLDEDFHRTMINACGRPRTWLLLQQMNTHYNRLRLLRLADNYAWQLIVAQHQEIADAIRGNRPDEAERVLRAHLSRVEDEKEELKLKYPAYFRR